MSPLPPEAVEILLVEDNPGDVRLTREALTECKLRNRLNIVSDGEKALTYLRREPPFQDAVRPDLILLDLDLPRRSGMEILSDIKSDPDLKTIPVVILTTSTADEDVFQSYSLHANCYVAKPLGIGEFLDVVKSIESFWLSIVKLPPDPDSLPQHPN